jgi:hypothetical protein
MNTYPYRAHSIGTATTALFIGVLLFVPLAASAQSYDSWREWFGRDSELQQKIAALPTAAIESLPIPVLLGVVQSDLTRNFGDLRDGGTRTHEGLDIMAMRDTPIVSPTEAVVTRLGTGTSEGNYVYTAGPGGETFAYMHLSQIGEGVARGTVLARGDLVGYVGNTGNASGGAPHLHFEIRKNGATDPYPRLTHTFSDQERMAFLTKILSATSDASLAERLLSNFRSTFTDSRAAGVGLPPQITALLGSQPVPAAANSTDATIAALLAQIQALQAQLAALQGQTPSFARDLRLGSTGEDVRALQIYLNAQGFAVATAGAGAPGQETTYFGPATRAALARFQAAHGIEPAVGYFGPLTRAAL